MLEKGELVWVARNELDIYLRSHVADEPQLLVEKYGFLF